MILDRKKRVCQSEAVVGPWKGSNQTFMSAAHSQCHTRHHQIYHLETDIVDLECASESTGNLGYIEILKTKKMALANLLDTKVGCACPVPDPKHHRDGCSIEFLL